MTRFDAQKPTSVSICEYVESLHIRLNCDEAIYTAALIYIDRVVSKHPSFLVTSRNVNRFASSRLHHFRLFLTCVMIADKFLIDNCLRSSDYGSVEKLKDCEMNALEHELLTLIDFDLYIAKEKYESYSRKLTAFSVREIHRAIRRACRPAHLLFNDQTAVGE